ncbi:alpha/beta fold hydrolase [Metabacillus sp. GX 13764]|uniref:alpha/beta hydrolase n=1 Tax=Metabacillus kandeliae TaxID=2900151 RepID=UPI001E5FB40B|nr:alpha/beta fold hydrolase [Metabacillus kandeliae]
MTGCLCIHGFTGGPYEVEPLAQYLAKNSGWDVRVPTLPGHGETLNLRGIKFNQWVEHAEEELKNLLAKENEVYLVGFSMGGMIASYLSIKYPVSKLVLLSAAAYYVNPKQIFRDILGMAGDIRHRRLKENELFTRYKKKFQSTPISAAYEFRKLVKYVKPHLSDIRIPVLIIQGESDGIVPVKSARYLYSHVGSSEKKLCFLPQSKHLVCLDCEFDILTEEVDAFLTG